MSGAKRRSGYRKTVSNDAIYSFPEPAATECIAQVTGMLGSNLFSVCVVKPTLGSADDETSVETTFTDKSSTLRHGIAVLPTRFKNAIWVRRGGFLIVGDESSEPSSTSSASSVANSDKARFRVEHILFPEQIKHLKTRGLWPVEFEMTRVSSEIDNNEDAREEDDDEDEDDDDEENLRRRRLYQHVPRNRPGDLPSSEYDNEDAEDNYEEDNKREVDVREIRGARVLSLANRNLHLPELIIRQLSEVDVDDAYALLVECGLWLDKTYGLKHWSPPYAKSVMQLHAREHFLFSVTTIVDKDERLVGTFTVGTKCWIPYFADIPSDTWRDKDEKSKPLYLGKLAVSPSEHNRGIGKALMKKVDEIAREKDCSSIRFDAIEKVPGLRNFYEAVGYTVVGKISAKDAKGTLNDLLLFEKMLS